VIGVRVKDRILEFFLKFIPEASRFPTNSLASSGDSIVQSRNNCSPSRAVLLLRKPVNRLNSLSKLLLIFFDSTIEAAVTPIDWRARNTSSL